MVLLCSLKNAYLIATGVFEDFRDVGADLAEGVLDKYKGASLHTGVGYGKS